MDASFEYPHMGGFLYDTDADIVVTEEDIVQIAADSSNKCYFPVRS